MITARCRRRHRLRAATIRTEAATSGTIIATTISDQSASPAATDATTASADASGWCTAWVPDAGLAADAVRAANHTQARPLSARLHDSGLRHARRLRTPASRPARPATSQPPR